jgi:hypothetical protein
MNCKLARAAWALIFVTAWSGLARATDDSAKLEARNLAKAAKRDFDAGRLEDAQRKFENAYAIAKVPTLALWTARVLVKRGQFMAGAEAYRQAAQLARNDLWIGNAQEQAQAEAKRELAGLLPRIPKLRIYLQGAVTKEVALTVDDVNVAGLLPGSDLQVDPGRHRIVGKTHAQTLELAVELVEGERKDAFLKFNDGARAASSTGSDRTPATDPAGKALLAPFPSGHSAANLTSNSLPREPVDSGRPVYAKWWFWTGIGAVAIAGTVTALALAHHSTGACSGASVPCVEVK